VQTRGELDLVKQAADLQVELEFGDTRGQGKLRFASFESPQISANLHFNVLAPALLALAGPDAAAADAAAASDAAADAGAGHPGAGHPGAGHPGAISNDDSPDPDPGAEQALPLNAIRAMDTRVVLSIDRAIFAGHVVKKLQVKLRAVDGIVKINSLTGKLHGGELAMTATINAQHNTARLNTKGGLIGMDIAKALKAVDAEPVMSGKADLDWRLGSRGTSSAQLLEAMRGPIKLAGSGVTLHQLGIEKLLCEAVALANGESLAEVLPDSTRFKTLSADLKMNRGELQMKPLRAELSQVKLTGEGALDLLKQDFSVTFTARLSPGLAELDPACRVNERITAIGWPVNCEGSITGDPAGWCSVDSQQIIEDLATREVQRKLEKEAGKFLDKFLN
jgi:uncharacterized protein involved in outer membrane biogenesis